MFEKMTKQEIKDRLDVDYVFNSDTFPGCSDVEYTRLNDELYKRVCKAKPTFYSLHEIVEGVVHYLVNHVTEEEINYD